MFAAIILRHRAAGGSTPKFKPSVEKVGRQSLSLHHLPPPVPGSPEKITELPSINRVPIGSYGPRVTRKKRRADWRHTLQPVRVSANKKGSTLASLST
jgi:hypothetical protein